MLESGASHCLLHPAPGCRGRLEPDEVVQMQLSGGDGDPQILGGMISVVTGGWA
jgi:hypothetical protein